MGAKEPTDGESPFGACFLGTQILRSYSWRAPLGPRSRLMPGAVVSARSGDDRSRIRIAPLAGGS
jgi:hypothetical protein